MLHVRESGSHEACTRSFDERSTHTLDGAKAYPEKLYGEIPYLKDSEVLTVSPNTLVCSVERGEPVKVLLDALVAGRELYGSFFNPHVALKALAYFGDGNLDTLSVEVQEYLKQSADALDLAELSSRVERLT